MRTNPTRGRISARPQVPGPDCLRPCPDGLASSMTDQECPAAVFLVSGDMRRRQHIHSSARRGAHVNHYRSTEYGVRRPR